MVSCAAKAIVDPAQLAVWLALYLGMAIAAWLVWRRAGVSAAKLALTLFALQLVLNVGWSAIFFTLHRPGFAFAETVLLSTTHNPQEWEPWKYEGTVSGWRLRFEPGRDSRLLRFRNKGCG